MAGNSAFTPKASLTEAPTNLKEAIDWVLRVTGKDGKKLGDGECICGLAAAVTDLLQSVQLEYHGYEGDTKDAGTTSNKGPPKERVEGCLNGLFSLVQGLGGTAVVRTYIDQLAQVLSALVGWSKIDKCSNGGDGKCTGNNGKGNQHGKEGCAYLKDVTANTPCDKCGCMKWDDPKADSNEGHHLGRRCTRCSSGGSSTCKPDGTCVKESYRSSYLGNKHLQKYGMAAAWKAVEKNSTLDGTVSHRRHQCARILLGSVCLIWSGITYMYWTGKYHKSSPRWNNHILDGTGLDDGTLSQWLQALGFPKDMLNNHGPGNRWDAIIWDGLMGMLYLGFPDTSPSGSGVHGHDYDDNTFRQPAGMNYAGYIHTLEKGAFCSKATVFKNGDDATITEENIHKCGALFKLYILSCAYFTGLQKKTPPQAENRTPKTIREILYWLSALPYSQAYPMILEHSKEVLKKVAPDVQGTQTLSFLQTGRTAPITVHEFNLFAHFQAVTQYCPLVLIGIQGGLHSTKGPAIHALYANTECNFTYPSVDIQAYNQVVHYIRALFYQLYFLRKQCAVKVTCGGKWRECRYGGGVVSKGVISWMCLGCDPMEHDRKKRVEDLKKGLDGMKTGSDSLISAVKTLLKAIGEVVIQLGNAQEALERKKADEITKVKDALGTAKTRLDSAKKELESARTKLNGDGLDVKLQGAKDALEALTNNGGNSGILGELAGDRGLEKATNKGEYDPGKNKICAAIHKVLEVLKLLKDELSNTKSTFTSTLPDWVGNEFMKAIKELISLCNTAKCSACDSHSKKCGQPSNPTVCPVCLQPTTTGVPSPLQAFLEDRLPGFSCREVPQDENPEYPPAASHLGHCNGSGQCCPLPMGFRGQFQGNATHTGQRLYGILYFFSNENMMQSCVYTLVRVTAALSATTPQVLGDVFGFFRGGVGNEEKGKPQKGDDDTQCQHEGDPSDTSEDNKSKYFCGWCASGLRDVVKQIEWIPNGSENGGKYMDKVGKALRDIKGDKDTSGATTTSSSLSTLTDGNHYVSPLTGELYTAVSATFGGTYLSWVLYLSDALEGGLKSLASAFLQIECRGCKGQCDPNKCKKGEHGQKSDAGSALCNCSSIVSCTGVLPVLYRHGFGYGNPFNLEGYHHGTTRSFTRTVITFLPNLYQKSY